MTDFNVLNSKFISVSEISERTGFSPDDIIIELQRRGTAPIRMGNNFYLTADMLSVLFSQDNTDIFVTNQPICATDIDNRSSAELSLPQLEGREVLRVANATISFVSKEGRKKPYMVQRRVYFEDGGFKRVTKCFETREAAEDYAAKVDEERGQTVHSDNCYPVAPPDRGVDIKCSIESVSNNMIFFDYLIYFINDSGQYSCDDTTKDCYEDAANLIRSELEKTGNSTITLGELNDSILNKLFVDIAQRCCQSYLNKAFDLTKKALKYAWRKKCIREDIANLIDKPKSKIKRKKRTPYSDEEIKMMLDAAKFNTRLYTFICVALYTGMRPAEIRALKWSDIDWSNSDVHVNGAVKKKRNKSPDSKKHIEYIGGTKSERGIRIIPLADSLANILKNWRTVCEHDPVGKDSKFIFFDESGDFMKEECYSSMWGRFIQKNGWTGRNYIVYRFRHTFCTRLLLSGRTLQEVQALMGDSSLDVIIEIYSGIESENVLERSRENVNNIYAIA